METNIVSKVYQEHVPKILICVCINNKEYQKSGFEAILTMFTFIGDS
jgi:hypothetical protein